MSNEKLREAVFIVLEGFTLDYNVRKILEAAYYRPEALATTEPEPTGMPELPEPDRKADRWPISHVYTAYQMLTYGEQCWKSGYKHGAWGDKPEPTSKQSLHVEPAVNQQLTTGPVDELPEPHAVITGKLGAHCSFNSNELRKGDPIYTADRVQAYGKRCWNAGFRHGDLSDENISYLAQIRDAVAEICPGASEGLLMNAIGGPCEVPRYVIDVVQELKQDAERYRWLASSESNAMDAKSQDHQWAISDAWTTLEKLDADKALIDAAIDAAMAQGVK